MWEWLKDRTCNWKLGLFGCADFGECVRVMEGKFGNYSKENFEENKYWDTCQFVQCAKMRTLKRQSVRSPGNSVEFLTRKSPSGPTFSNASTSALLIKSLFVRVFSLNSTISQHLHQPWYQAGHSETSLPRLLDPEDHWAFVNKLSRLLFFPFRSLTYDLEVILSS